jgi:hypothetical protein
MKVLFLDIDGVLNCASSFVNAKTRNVLDSGMIKQINHVVLQTGCSIVISSTWRLLFELEELKQVLRDAGLIARIIGVTPRLGRRDNEIISWMADNPEVTHFAVIDDDTFDLTGVATCLVATKFETGTTAEHAEMLIKMLNEHEKCVEPDAPKFPCVICGAVVFTCEREEPVNNNYACPMHPNGCEFDGKWVCSLSCYDEAVLLARPIE